MPVKITTTTNSQTGRITNADLNKMKDDFENDIIITRGSGLPIVKKLAWYVTREELESFFSLNKNGTEEPTVIEINFAIHLNQLNLCDGEPLTDSITVVLQAKNNNHETVNANEEFVLIPGYDTFTGQAITLKNLHGAICCPSSKPPTH